MSLRLRSDAFDDGDELPERYRRSGGNVSPPLDWDGVPADTAELVLLCEDLDAGPGGSRFVHWLLGGLPPDYDGLGEGEQPEEAVAGRNDYGEAGYSGPEPPAGHEHRYRFAVLCLRRPSGLTAASSGRDLAAVLAEEIDRAQITVTCRVPSGD